MAQGVLSSSEIPAILTSFTTEPLMPEMNWIDDVPMPAMSEKEHQESSEHYEDSDWWNDPNCVMSRHHY